MRAMKIILFLLLISISCCFAQERIVSLSPALTELVCLLGKEKQLVGRSDVCNYPASVKSVPVAGRFGMPYVEKVMQLKPTLVIANDLINPNLIKTFEQNNIKCRMIKCRNIAEYSNAVKELSILLNAQTEGQKELDRIRTRLSNPHKSLNLKVLWVIWDAPLMVAGKNSLPDELIRLAGGKNVAADVPQEYFKCSFEWLLKQKIDLIVWTAAPNGWKRHDFWQNLEAVKKQNIIHNIDHDLTQRPGPRIFEGIDLLHKNFEFHLNKNKKPEEIKKTETSFFDPVTELRLVRLLAALIIGGSLALSGAIFQAVLKNVLAEPFTLGISGGAGIGAALAFVTGLSAFSLYAIPFAALAGGLAVLVLVLLVSRAGNFGTESLLLAGVIAGTVSSSILMYILSIAETAELANVTWWMLGDLQSVDKDLLLFQTVYSLTALIILQFFAKIINAVSLGDEQAFYLGVNVKKVNVLLIIIAALLAAGTVAMAGIISFCGLIIPHIVRRIIGSDHRKNLIITYITGGVFLALCDFGCRVFFEERELPIGVLTALIGGPVYLFILFRRHKNA